jgi:hypothetical protein
MSTVVDPFEVTVSSNGGGEGSFELPPAGTYPAVLVGVVDLGTQSWVFNGEAKKARKIFLAWELVGEHDSKGRPFVLGQDYTLSLNAKANYRALVEAWTGKTFADGQKFNITDMVGKPCLLTVTEGQSGNGKKFAEIAGVAAPLRNMTVAEPANVPFVFSVRTIHSSADLPEVPDWMPRSYGKPLGDVIKASEEFGNLPNF